jgi:dTDP-4-amino-4,6-dideoxygalactose transaminase/predicted dehydrogenase
MMIGKLRRAIQFVQGRRRVGESWKDIVGRVENEMRFGRKANPSKVGRRELKAVARVIKSGHLRGGSQVRRFSQRFKELYGVNAAIASTSGTAAIHVAVAAVDPQPGDEIIVPAVTDIGTINPILFQTAIPVFADIHPDTWCIDPRSVEKLMSARTRAVIAVHLFGNPCDMDALRTLSVRHGVYLIEDCAQAHFSRYRGQLCGTIGDMGTFSFQHSKQLTTGEGGMTITNNPAFARRAELFVDKGWNRDSRLAREYPLLGLNYRPTELQAAVGLVQLERGEALIAQCARNGRLLADLLADAPGISPQLVHDSDTSTWWQFGLKVAPDAPFTAKSLGRALQGRGVPASTRYMTDPVFRYHEPLLQRRLFGGSPAQLGLNPESAMLYGAGVCPVAEDTLGRLVLVVSPNERFTERDVQRLAREIRATVESMSRSIRGPGGLSLGPRSAGRRSGDALPSEGRAPVEVDGPRRWRVGVIGCGVMGRDHVREIQGLSALEVVALADTNLATLKTVGGEEGIAAQYTDYRAMLSQEKLDVAVVCTWPGLHAEVTIAAVDAGVKTILCEKPIALNLAEADAMLGACRRHDARLVVGHQHRFNPHINLAREAIRSGKIGEIRHLWGQHRSALLNNGTHLVDCIRYILDGEPVLWAYGQVDRSGRSRDRGHAAEDAATAVIRFRNGIRMTIETGLIADPQHFRLYIYGTKGQIAMSYADITVMAAGAAPSRQELPTDREFSDQYQELLACLEGRAVAHRNDGMEARAALEVLIAVLESSRRGEPIHFPVRQMAYPLDVMDTPGLSSLDDPAYVRSSGYPAVNP